MIEFTDVTLKEALASNKPVLVDFFAEWCGPCKMMKPVLEKMASDFNGKVIIGSLDVEKFRTATMEHKVSSLPTLTLFVGGKVVKQFIGLTPDKIMRAALEPYNKPAEVPAV